MIAHFKIILRVLRELSWALILRDFEKSFEQSWKSAQEFCFENEFEFEIFFVCLDSNFLNMISSLNVRVLDLKIIRSRHLRSGFRTEVYESHWEETFWETTCFRKNILENSCSSICTYPYHCWMTFLETYRISIIQETCR